MSLKVVVPESTDKLKQTIKALEYLLETDTSKKDRRIHEEALTELRKALEQN